MVHHGYKGTQVHLLRAVALGHLEIFEMCILFNPAVLFLTIYPKKCLRVFLYMLIRVITNARLSDNKRLVTKS